LKFLVAMKKLITLLWILGTVVPLQAQSDLSLPFMNNVFQASYLNPTVRSEHTLSIGFPFISSISTQVIHNGFVPSSAFKFVNDKLTLFPDKIPAALNKQNMLYAGVGMEFFHLRFKRHNWDYWFSVRQVHEMSFFYPKDLVALSVYGNGKFIGQTLDLTPLGANLSLYREYSFGMAAETNHWVFGGRISLLQGLSNAYFKPNSLSISIDDDMYSHTVNAQGTLYTTGIPLDSARMPNFEKFIPDDFSLSTAPKTYLFDYLTRFRNPGFALSAGLTYKFDQRTTFTFAFSDLGFIHWSDSTQNFLLKGNHRFEGADMLVDFLYGRDIDYDAIMTTILDSFSDEETNESYLVWLSPKFYFRGNYKIAKRTELGFQLYTTYNRRFYPAFTVGIQHGVGYFFNLLLTGSVNQRSFTNLGLGLLLKPGPMQIYILADNYFSPVFDPLSFTNLNFRLGVNMVFGRAKKPQDLP